MNQFGFYKRPKMNVSYDESRGRKHRRLNENSSFKNEVLNILLKVIDLESNQSNDKTNCTVSYETDGLTKSVGYTSEKTNETAPYQRSLYVEKLCSVVNNWRSGRKLIYGLKNQYPESYLLFGNLNTDDKAVANFLLDIANSSDLKVFLAVFNKTSSFRYVNFNLDGYEHEAVTFEPDENDAFGVSHSYTLESLVSSNDDHLLSSSLIDVDLEEEVIPEDIFNGIEPYKKTVEHTGHNRVKICKFYRCAAITMWPLRHFLQILKKFGASSVDIEKIFLKEIENSEINEGAKKILMTWAEEILSNLHSKSITVIKAIVGMENVPLIKMLFSRCVTLNENSISILEETCEKYGWTTFATEIPTMFRKLTRQVAIKLLTKLVLKTGELLTEKRSIYTDILKVILEKCNNHHPLHPAWYSRSAKFEDKVDKRIEEQDILLSICQLAQKLSFDMLAFAQNSSLVEFVPVLLQLAPNPGVKLDMHWLEVCQYFVHVMEAEAVRPLAVPNWKRDDSVSCNCVDCLKLNEFLQSDVESIGIKVGKERRRHLHEKMNALQNIVHETDRSGLREILVVTKLTKTGCDEEEKQEFSKNYLDNLRAVTPI